MQAEPCADDLERKSWAEHSCSVITSDLFHECHQVVPNYIDYYKICLKDACEWVDSLSDWTKKNRMNRNVICLLVMACTDGPLRIVTL